LGGERKNMEIITPELVAAIGLFLGVLGRVFIPYMIRLWKGEIKTFQIYYIWQGLAGLGLSAVVVILVAPNMLINTGATFVQLIVANFAIGMGSTELISEIFGLRDLKKEEVPAPAP